MKLIKITATWCMSCIFMNELLKKIEKENSLNYQIIDLDFDNDNDEIDKYNVGNILPIFIILDNKQKEIRRLTGEKSLKELKKFLLEESDFNI